MEKDFALSLERVSKSFTEEKNRALHVLNDISLEIKEGEFFVCIGPSGSGKSTLLRIMSGLEKSFKGARVLGAGVGDSDISFVFQQFALLPWLTVFENVALGLAAHGVSADARIKPVLRELTLLGLDDFANHYPHELSGGMQQRVGIARALVTRPKIIFMDEPFSELDSFTAEALRKEVLDIWQKYKITIVMVTHIIGDAVELSDRIAVLTSRPGRVERVVENTLPRPRHTRSHEFYSLYDTLHAALKP